MTVTVWTAVKFLGCYCACRVVDYQVHANSLKSDLESRTHSLLRSCSVPGEHWEPDESETEYTLKILRPANREIKRDKGFGAGSCSEKPESSPLYPCRSVHVIPGDGRDRAHDGCCRLIQSSKT